MDEIDPADIKKETARITEDWEYPLGKPKEHVIEKAIRMYMATVRLCEEKKFDTFAYKCVDGVDLEMGLTHAVPSSLIADAGYPYVDENDLGNSVAQLMLKIISGKQVTFLEHYEHHPDWILLGEDGYCPNDFIEGKPQIKDVSTVLLDGIAHCSNMKKGRMTMACLSEVKDGYRMHIVTGEGKERPKWVEMGVPLPSWPSLTFYPDATVRKILDHVQSQHFAAVFGNYVDELIDGRIRLMKSLDEVIGPPFHSTRETPLNSRSWNWQKRIYLFSLLPTAISAISIKPEGSSIRPKSFIANHSISIKPSADRKAWLLPMVISATSI